jgi:hypothetical protein
VNTTIIRHSPAPWSCGEVEYTSTESPVFEIRDDDDRYVASVSDEADADLVTAAPDLLAACELMLTVYGLRQEAPHAFETMRSAVVKARGEKP